MWAELEEFGWLHPRQVEWALELLPWIGQGAAGDQQPTVKSQEWEDLCNPRMLRICGDRVHSTVCTEELKKYVQLTVTSNELQAGDGNAGGQVCSSTMLHW
jgi:hypothetical protein